MATRQLTQRQQDILAVLLTRLRPTVYAVHTDKPINGADLVDTIADWVMAMNVSATELDEIYNVMHRGGLNI